jgi:hypothetical protein
MVVLTTIALGGLSVALLQENRGATVDVARTEGQIRALELAEMGIARAEIEIASKVDPDGDGVGNIRGNYAGGSYAVTAVASANGVDWTLVSTGQCEKASRRIEEGCRRIPPILWHNALFTQSTVNLSGSTVTDAYDSRLGTYASQAVNTDAAGTYALSGGDIASNGSIITTAKEIRGDAIPGPTGTVSGNGTVTGSTTPSPVSYAFPPPPLADFTAAYNSPDNGNWTSTGSVVYDANKRILNVSGGATVTFPGGTYFFSTLSVSGNSSIVFTGPTKIYVTVKFDTSGGTIVNTGGYAGDLQVYAHPYDFPIVKEGTSTTVNISGGTGTALCVYGPQADLTVSGGSDVFGSLMVGTAAISGGAFLHYDDKLAANAGPAKVTRAYWVERHLPLW